MTTYRVVLIYAEVNDSVVSPYFFKIVMSLRPIKFLIISVVFLLVCLSSSVPPVLAHSGHNHNLSSPEQHDIRQIPEPQDNTIERQSSEQAPWSENSQSGITPAIENINNQVEGTGFFQYLPQFGEVIFLSLFLVPLGLFSLKRWIQQRQL